jgi:NAD-dependent dihydropyrimidine dehydrogenase PreA subunit
MQSVFAATGMIMIDSLKRYSLLQASLSRCIIWLSKREYISLMWDLTMEAEVNRHGSGKHQVTDMSIERINPELCNGCGTCINSCSIEVIRMDEKAPAAVIQYPEDCMCCGYCELDCPVNAIYVSPVK